MASLAGQNDFILLRAAFPEPRDASGSPLIRQLPLARESAPADLGI